MADPTPAAAPPVRSTAWLEAFTAEGFELRRERAWDPAEVHRGGIPDALEVTVSPEQVAFALVVDEETDAVFLLPPDPGTDREALGVARFSLTGQAGAGSGDRGAVGLLARVILKGPGRKLINVLTGTVARAAAATWERRYRPEQVRLFRPRDPAEGAPLKAEEWTRLAEGPSLLWLHGPFVQARSGFGGLDRDLWNALADTYEGRVWAYDHHTVSKAPRRNARDLLQLVGEAGVGPMVVDVIAHSRGGLVARELAERPRAMPVTVRSLVLAGTPNLGTPLADARGLVAGINRFTNLLALAPDPVSDITGAVVAVVTHVLGEAVGELPGITAMAPPAKNPSYLAELNELAPAKDVRYRLVAGEYEPGADASRLGRAFRNWVVDTLLKDDANDLVVPSRSALGSGRVPAGEGTTVTGVAHTAFWRSPEMTGHLSEWLLGSVRAVTPPLPVAPPEPVAAPEPAEPEPEPAATLLDLEPEPAAVEPAAVEPADTLEAVATPEPAGTPHLVATSEPAAAQPDVESEPAAPTATVPSAPDPAAEHTSTEHEPAPMLEVALRHASLEHAPYALLVGHFAGAPLSGAEARLDDRLGGRLTRLTLLNQYPRELGESALLLPVDDDTPRGVLILGLGPTGELTGAQLSAVVTRGLLRLANQHLEQLLAGGKTIFPPLAGDPRRLAVSSVPIGTSWGGGLTVEGCVRALVAGVTTANERLRRLMVPSGETTAPASSFVRFDRLEVIERYADRVDLLADALDRLAEQAGQDVDPSSTPTAELTAGGRRDEPLVRVRFLPRPESGEGASNANPPLDPSEDVWRRVGIAAVSPPPSADNAATSSALQLEFTSMGRLARAERLLSEIEPNVVNPILDRAIGRHSDPAVSGTLYELLVPHLLKGELNDGENLHLLVDRTTAIYPWELLSGRPEEANPQVPLALRVGVLRQFREAQDLRYDIRRSASNTILVVGNPPPGPGFDPLPGAAEEAKAVDALFRDKGWAQGIETLVWDEGGERVPVAPPAPSGAEPRPVVDQDPGEEVLHRFLNGDWRIVHMAAHGQVTEDSATTGIVIGGQFHLTAKVLASLSVVPDLVFLNACHVGQIPNRELKGMNRVAASVAEALLRIGVRAVVAAGWAVNDHAAKAFAVSLYSDLLKGRHFGEAVFEARKEAKAAAPASLTWGAYQCYGDPGFRLVARHASTRRRPPQTAGELRRRVQRLRAAASDQGRAPDDDHPVSKRALEQQLRGYHALATTLGSTGALADLAEVHAELGAFDRAAVLYRTALRRGGKEVPLRAMEQVGNMLSRWAHRRVRRGRATYADVRATVDQAEWWLQQALTVGQTEERLALLGGFHKRCATMTEGADRVRHLRLAIEGYACAQRLHDAGFQRHNWVQLYHVLCLLGVESDPMWLEQFSVHATVIDPSELDDGPEVVLSAPQDPNQGPRRVAEELRWRRFERGDRILTAGLVTGTLQVDRLVHTYGTAFKLRSSVRERGSVIEHVEDLSVLVPHHHALHDALVSALVELRRADRQPEGTP